MEESASGMTRINDQTQACPLNRDCNRSSKYQDSLNGATGLECAELPRIHYRGEVREVTRHVNRTSQQNGQRSGLRIIAAGFSSIGHRDFEKYLPTTVVGTE